MKPFVKGTTVTWAWGQGHGTGVIKEKYTDSVHKMLQGAEITRNGTPDNPAYLIEQEDGAQVLKLHSELSPQK